MSRAFLVVSLTVLGGFRVASAALLVRKNCNPSPNECGIRKLWLRGTLGFPVQVEKKSDTEYEATLCEDVSSFRTFVEQGEPVFSKGITCGITGLPGGPIEVEAGGFQTVTLTTAEGTDGKKTEYTLTV